VPTRALTVIDAFLTNITLAEFDESAAKCYGAIRSELESRGTPIGPLDNLIAAQALSLGVTLVTNNVREFVRVAGMAVEDWTQV
jgi:tRNA(fMet)-specific endonuclease VapC